LVLAVGDQPMMTALTCRETVLPDESRPSTQINQTPAVAGTGTEAKYTDVPAFGVPVVHVAGGVTRLAEQPNCTFAGVA
jgi:hypothetical protein